MVGLPGPHPLPPPDFAHQPLPITEHRRVWLRFHAQGRAAIYWGVNPPRRQPARWDSPDGSYGVLYVGADVHAAFIETFGHNTGIRLLEQADLAARCLSRIAFQRPLRLVPVTGPDLARLGVDARLFTADYGVARQWSRAIHRHPSMPDGILYPSRHDETRLCAAILDRCAPLVTDQKIGTLVESQHATLLGDLLDTYGLGLI